MQVIKRNGEKQDIDFEKIHWRIKSMCAREDILNFQKEKRPDAYNVLHKLPSIDHASVDTITKKTIEGLYNNMSTKEIDSLSAEIAQEMCVTHPDNSVLATRILVSNIQKNILEVLTKCFPQETKTEIQKNLFKFSMRVLSMNLDKKNKPSPLIAPYLLKIAEKYSDRINNILDFSRDFLNHDYLGIQTLEKSYLFRFYSLQNYPGKNELVETPSMADLRIALGLICAPTPCPTSPEEYSLQDVEVTEEQWIRIREIYFGMSTGKFTPATPTRFSMGALRPQGSSCFLIAMQDDSLKGIFNTLAEQAQISKYAGGIGIHVHNIRSAGSYISGTNGHSNGLKPMLKVFNAVSEYVDQGGGKRPGSVAIYLEPWHPDIVDFVRMKRKKGADSDRARTLFYALWIPDEFFRAWKAGQPWYLFDPSICPKLYDSYDQGFSATYLTDEFVQANKQDYLFTYRYRKYVRQQKYEKKINLNELMEEIVETVRDGGIPYMTCKDATNRKSNQKNLGVIKSLNLCSEIAQYSDSKNTATCNLHSICINTFIKPWEGEDFKYDVSLSEVPEYKTFDFESFANTVRICVQNVDRLIDLNYYPTENARRSNMSSRPQATGLQGEADLMALLRLPWNGKEAQRLRFAFMERMYYECLKTSVELAKISGPYPRYEGSPASLGILQFDMWKTEGKKISFDFRMPWDELKRDIAQYGLRNSLFIAPMPTASTSSIMGNSPSIEPFNSLVYVRKAGSLDVTIINKNLVDDLMSLNLWNKSMSDKIMENHGSIQDITQIPKKLRNSYLTVYDLEPADIIDAAYVRGWFVDQSQSMNLFFKNVTMSELSKAWLRGWNRGLKTLSYYCRSRGAFSAQKAQIQTEKEVLVCSRDNPDCLSCGS